MCGSTVDLGISDRRVSGIDTQDSAAFPGCRRELGDFGNDLFLLRVWVHFSPDAGGVSVSSQSGYN
jgi:hypothetical protein